MRVCVGWSCACATAAGGGGAAAAAAASLPPLLVLPLVLVLLVVVLLPLLDAHAVRLAGADPGCACPPAGVPHVKPSNWLQSDWGSVEWLPFLNM